VILISRLRLDLEGHRAGIIVFKKPTDKREYGQAVWLAECERCGKEHHIRIGRRNRALKCSCQMRPQTPAGKHFGLIVERTEPYIGSRFGHLTLLRVLPNKIGDCYVWELECVCGTVITCNSAIVRQGGRTSCGCSKSNRWGRVDALDRVIKGYKHRAKERKLAWELKQNEAKSLLQSSCHYCGSAPSLDYYGVLRNGIDRVDNNLGYLKKNVVSCCSLCNTMKLDLPTEQFLAHIRRISQNQGTL
jgi:hypothetical protein